MRVREPTCVGHVLKHEVGRLAGRHDLPGVVDVTTDPVLEVVEPLHEVLLPPEELVLSLRDRRLLDGLAQNPLELSPERLPEAAGHLSSSSVRMSGGA